MKKGELRQLNAVAGAEFNYEGSGYIGQNDPELDFGGNGKVSSFLAEHARNRSFTVKLKNTFTTDKVIALCPAFFDTLSRLSAAGHSDVDAIFADGDILVDGVDADLKITCSTTNSSKSIYAFNEFIKRNPTRIVGFSMQSNQSAQFDQTITVENQSPFVNLGNQIINLTDYRPPNQLSETKIAVNLVQDGVSLEFNDQNLIKLPLVAGADITINFYVGGIINIAKKLNTKAVAAHSEIRQKNAQMYQCK